MMIISSRKYLYSILTLSIIFSCITFSGQVHAQSADEIQIKINQRTQDIQNLEKEIAEFQKQINIFAGQASTLSATIKSLDLTQKKLAADISLTEKKISAKSLEIQSLSSQIKNKEMTIEDSRRIISNSLVAMNKFGDNSLPELMLATASLSGLWESTEQLALLQKSLVDHIDELREVKVTLETNKKSTEKAKLQLIELNNQLKDQRKVVLTTTAEKNTLLKTTKQSETEYQRLLAQRKALKDAFEKEIFEYESRLKLAVDASRLPPTGSGILSWPLDGQIVITQYFGNTEFATANSQIYNGKGHNGIDLRASIGTIVRSAYSGVVTGVGNTDVGSCVSLGKWIVIKHPNGLSTLYAHLSLHSVSIGDNVLTGQIIGYSGNTGASTGPHLHFSVYATEGIQIRKFEESVYCKNVVLPTASFNARLNPLSYLSK